MTAMRACLFGRFHVACDDHDVDGLDARRVQELLAYLLLTRGHAHPREQLGDVLWGDVPAEQVRKGLRQTLWKLQSCLERTIQPLLRVDGEYVALDDRAAVWLDVAAFEDAHRAANGTPGSGLDAATAERLMAAAELYRGNLLEGWYNDWCLEERERLLSMYLSMLNKLTAYCAVHGLYDAGLDYGHRALHHDRAHERTHRHVMRLYALSGDRCCALRQYRRCVDALREDLGVGPARSTVALYRRIQADDDLALSLGISVASMFGVDPAEVSLPGAVDPPADQITLAALLGQLAELRAGVAAVERHVADYLGQTEANRRDRSGP